MNKTAIFITDALYGSYNEFREHLDKHELNQGKDEINASTLCERVLDLTDYAFTEHGEKVPFKNCREWREKYLYVKSPELELTCDIANAFKHSKISRQGRLINNEGDLEEQVALIKFYKESSQEHYYAITKHLVVKTEGKENNLEKIIHESILFLLNELVELGIVPPVSPFTSLKNYYISEEKAKLFQILKIIVPQGIQYNKQAKMLKFDPESNDYIPIDKNEHFNYKPQINLEVIKSPFSK